MRPWPGSRLIGFQEKTVPLTDYMHGTVFCPMGLSAWHRLVKEDKRDGRRGRTDGTSRVLMIGKAKPVCRIV